MDFLVVYQPHVFEKVCLCVFLNLFFFFFFVVVVFVFVVTRYKSGLCSIY